MSKVRNLPELTSLSDNDLLYAVESAVNPNGGRKVTVANTRSAILTPAAVKAAYESNPNTNAYTDAEKAKLATVQANAQFQTAAQVPYDNTSSGLSATQVQDAIDEVNQKSGADFRPFIVANRILGYTGGSARFDGIFYSILGNDIILNPNITNGEVYVDLDGLVKQTGSGVSAPPYTIVFAKFSTDLNNIISLTDERVKNSQNIIRGILSDVRDVRAGAASDPGNSGRVSDAMHKHTILTGAASSQTPDQANAEGTSINLARADHVHDIPTATAVTLTPDLSNAQGSAATFSRADHVHNVPTATAVGLNANSTSTQGTSTSFARADHTHAIASGAASTQTPDQANAAGSSANFAKADHVHNIPTAVAVDITVANAQGSAASFARSDHTHKGLHSIKANAGTQRFGDTSLVNGLGANVTDDGSGNFTIDTNFGANEFVVTSFSGLQINYSGGRFRNGAAGTINTIPAGSITVGANITLGYLYVAVNNLSANGTVTASTTVPPLGSIPFATFTSNASTVTVTNDIRSFVNIESLSDQLRITYSGSGLAVSFNSGAVRINGTQTAVAAGSLTLTASSTGAIYVDVDGVVKSNTTSVFPPNSVPLAIYTTSLSTVTALTGNRSFINGNIQFGANSDIAALTPDLAAASGSTNKYADAGHVHNVPTAAPITTLSPAVSNAQGSASTFARSDHTHSIATALVADITTILPDDAAAAGVANTYVRGDHKHAIATAAAVTQTPDQANAKGTSTSFARADHVHQIATAAATGLNAGSTNTQGTSTSFARADHTHAIASGAASTQTPDQANAAGSSTNFARADHVHNIPTAAASSINTNSTNTQGAAASFARSDHTHHVTVNNQEATATVDDTTTSATDTLMNSMTQTPVAGTYLVMWSGSIVNSANGAERTWVSLYLNGSQVSATERSIGTAGGAYAPSMTQAIITTPGSQAIELRWRVAGGTSTVHSRRLTLVKLD